MQNQKYWIALCLLCSGSLAACQPRGNGWIKVDLSTATGRYCRAVPLPQGWQYPLKDSTKLDYPGGGVHEFEVRKGIGDGEFLVAGDFGEEFSPRYTTNKYRVKLTANTPVVTNVDERTWVDSPVVPLVRASIFENYSQLAPARGHAPYAGKVFAQSGEFWVDSDDSASRLSPDKKWLILQSRTRIGFGTAYFDVFSVAIGNKLVTIEAPFSHAAPDGDLRRTFWLTDKYFVIPVGERHDGFVICEFGSSN